MKSDRKVQDLNDRTAIPRTKITKTVNDQEIPKEDGTPPTLLRDPGETSLNHPECIPKTRLHVPVGMTMMLH